MCQPVGGSLFSTMIKDVRPRPVQASNFIVRVADDINLGIKVATHG